MASVNRRRPIYRSSTNYPSTNKPVPVGAAKRSSASITSEQLEIIPVQIRVIRHIRKTYARILRIRSGDPDKPALLME